MSAPRRSAVVVWMLLLGSLFAGCDGADGAGSGEAAVALDFDGHDCAACGMIVREQPAPRGQLVHRDGTRQYFCSVADMVTYMTAPSPHGSPTAVFVEVNDPAADPLELSPGKRPWLPAAQALYVLGVPRERVMGAPVLAYPGRADAERVAGAGEGRSVVSWDELRSRLGGSAQ